MKTQEFRALLDHLGDLSETQRSVIVDALQSKGSSSEVTAMIENRFAADPRCGHCQSESFGTWGHAKDLCRYKCTSCRRPVNALTGTPLAQLHRCDAWLKYARALVERVRLRKDAEIADYCLETSFRWRRRFLKIGKNKRLSSASGIVEADETFILGSAKGSRRIVEGATFAGRFEPIVAKDSVPVSDGRAACGAFAEANKMLHIAIIASHGEHVYECFLIQNVNAYTSRFKAWMAPLRGVASIYLDTYLGWRRMIERDGDRLTSRHCLAEALG